MFRVDDGPESVPHFAPALDRDERFPARVRPNGGPFNVFDEAKHPFLHDENRWIEQCLKTGVPLLGICQGAQSIARVLGGADIVVHEIYQERVSLDDVFRRITTEQVREH